MKRVLNPAAIAWRKSSYSDGGANNCVEVADGLPGAVPVRDSKTPTGGVLVFPAAVWSAFVAIVKAEHLS
ncbi:DUF397 domain-containing protein [Streptomyces lydicus]|uniref:DUF397 domain-containing protein n=1 Tax=Streptomyces lydicus TaxID=47763 RepID=UPI001011544B|nr:DUF397 domain-containing protein [Streptomyces lydicus]MCZ1008872.1 DUF397 domain-containing protein [Streptomyces lydicus]